MRELHGVPLLEASVPRGASFVEAASVLTAHEVPAIAVLDPGREVVGLFGSEELLRGVFPSYLGELHHTAFLRDDATLLADRAEQVRTEPVEQHMVRPVTVDLATSAAHVAERFLHCGLAALPVVDGARFVGMLDRDKFCAAMLARR
jgi:CBS domain-containing protein